MGDSSDGLSLLRHYPPLQNHHHSCSQVPGPSWGIRSGEERRASFVFWGARPTIGHAQGEMGICWLGHERTVRMHKCRYICGCMDSPGLSALGNTLHPEGSSLPTSSANSFYLPEKTTESLDSCAPSYSLSHLKP